MRKFTTMASKKPKEEEEKKKKKSSSSGKEAKPLKTPDKKTGTPKKQSKPKPKVDNKNNRSRNGTVDESEDPVDLSLSTESEESEPEREEERSMKTKNQCNKSPKPKKRKQKGGEEEDDDDDDEQKEEAKLCRFPMNRIKRIIKSGDCNKGITQDAIFLVNKATEKFLERFCEDAYHFTVKDRKKSLGYKHLSSVVSKQKRYEFISDFVPEKVKAEDVLKEMNLSESKLG